MKIDYSVQEKTSKYYWLYKYYKVRCKEQIKKDRKSCILGEPFYPIYQCSNCSLWWNNMRK